MSKNDQIIARIGDNNKKERKFTPELELSQGPVSFFYTSGGYVCILDAFNDIYLEDFPKKDQKIIHDAIMGGKYK